MTTSTATKTALTVRRTNVVDTTTEWGTPLQVTTFTLKGRLEFSKDGQAVMRAASKLPFVSELTVNYHTAEISFDIGFDGNVDPKMLHQVQKVVDEFGELLIADYKNSPKQLKSKGIEAHVFIQSLKPLDEYDGNRNGALASSLR